MKRSASQRLFAWSLALLIAVLPATASACTACMGDPNTKSAGAINGAIFIMLGFIALIFGSLGYFAYTLFRRSQAPVPPHVELSQMIAGQDSAH